MENRVDAILSEEAVAEAEAFTAFMIQHMAFAVALTPELRKTFLKLGDKSVPFVEKVLEAAKSHPDLIPPKMNIEQLENDLTLFLQLTKIIRVLSKMMRSMQDTAMVAGSEAYQSALMLYGYFQRAVDMEPGLAETVAEMGKRFAGQRVKRTPKPPQAPPAAPPTTPATEPAKAES